MELHPSENYREIFDATPDPICITRLSSWRIVMVNQEFERLTGFNKEDALGHTTVELGLWPNPTEQERCFRLMQAHGELRNLPMTMRMKDGSHRPYLLSASNIWLNGKRCTMTIARDVTTLRTVEAELVAARNAAEAASQAKSEFLSSMSHEIRTPMNAILGMAELLAETSLDDEQLRFLALMRSNGNALLALINDILDLARIERGLLHLESTDLDLRKTVQSVLEMLNVRASEKTLELAAIVAADVPVARVGDPLRLRQVLVNLVGNAIKFTDRGGITVDVRRVPEDQGLVHFVVIDTGIGIPPEKLSQIFSSFTQADSSTARRYGGSGLGLAIVSRLVELMGGRIWVESEIGTGSSFHFTVRLELAGGLAPLRPSHSPRKALAPISDLDSFPPLTQATIEPGEAKLSILVVDDSADNRFLLRSFFKRLPYALDEAENGSEAVAMFTKKRYDLVLMDMRMPVMDGIEATRAIRQWEREHALAAAPIIALTASALNEDVSECLAAGCDFHVSKPINKATLLAAVTSTTAVALAPQDASRRATPAIAS